MTVQQIAPSSKFVAFTKSDTEVFKYNGIPRASKRIYVGLTGNMAVKNDLGDTILIEAIPAGAVLEIVTNQILSTNTTAGKFIVLF